MTDPNKPGVAGTQKILSLNDAGSILSRAFSVWLYFLARALIYFLGISCLGSNLGSVLFRRRVFNKFLLLLETLSEATVEKAVD